MIAVAICIGRNRPGPQADAQIDDETGVVVFQAFEFGSGGCGCQSKGNECKEATAHKFSELATTSPSSGEGSPGLFVRTISMDHTP
jgi:hypothetical protein